MKVDLTIREAYELMRATGAFGDNTEMRAAKRKIEKAYNQAIDRHNDRQDRRMQREAQARAK